MVIRVLKWQLHELPILLGAMTRLSRLELERAIRAGRPLPRLDKSGVSYRREPPGQEVWATPRHVLEEGAGDCEDLSFWDAAEQQIYEGDQRARVEIYRAAPRTLHAIVRTGAGLRRDPSRRLGMGTP